MDQPMDFEACTTGDAHELAELRARAMKPGLQQVGRFDEERVRSRFLDSFVPQDTKKIIIEGVLGCLLYTSPSPRDRQKSRMPSSA